MTILVVWQFYIKLPDYSTASPFWSIDPKFRNILLGFLSWMLYYITLGTLTSIPREGESLGASSESVAGRWLQSTRTEVDSFQANRVLVGQ